MPCSHVGRTDKNMSNMVGRVIIVTRLEYFVTVSGDYCNVVKLLAHQSHDDV